MSFLDGILAMLMVALLAFSKPVSSNDYIFDRDSTASLRGIAMLGIMLHHIHNRLGLCSPILIQTGYITTGLFFFISGFGNMSSINKKESDIKWIRDKFLKIYIPFFIIYWLCFIGEFAFYRDIVPTGNEIIKDLATISLPNQTSWFPKIILLCFALHWLARIVFSNTKTQCAAVLIALCTYIAVMWKLGFAACWYNSVICYVFGMIISEYREYISTTLYEKMSSNIYIYIYSRSSCNVLHTICWCK